MLTKYKFYLLGYLSCKQGDHKMFTDPSHRSKFPPLLDKLSATRGHNCCAKSA